MECEKCLKITNTQVPCNGCSKQFCTVGCMLNHFLEKHKNIEKIAMNFPSTYLRKRSSSVGSCFMKQGEFLKETTRDPYYTFDNFEKVKSGKKTRLLGSGAFGDVYLVKHKIDGKLYAVKQMKKTRIIDACNQLDIVRKEIDIHSRLIHENIIRLYSYSEDENSFYLIMEYARAGTLFSVIKKNKGLNERRAFQYFIQTASAVHFLHENNLIHRDIKPENLLLDDNENIKLCDFGWCIELEIGNRMTFCGTTEYMAPEIIREEPYDKSIDVWSLGILLYELTHGYSPFRAIAGKEEENTEIFRNIIKYKFCFEKDISDSCKDLISKLISQDVGARIKAKDIFFHPFVQQFEKEHRKSQNISNNIQIPSEPDEKHRTKLSDKSLPNVLQEDNIQKSEQSNPTDPVPSLSPQIHKLSQPEQNIIKIKEILDIQKQKSVREAMSLVEEIKVNKKDNEYSLFDCVLAQVGEKNRDKKKKRKDSRSKERIDPQNNKIVMKFERVNINNNPIANVKPSEEIEKIDYDFQMLREAKDLQSQLDEQCSKLDKYKSKKNELSSELLRNITENKGNNPVKIFLDDNDVVKPGNSTNINLERIYKPVLPVNNKYQMNFESDNFMVTNLKPEKVPENEINENCRKKKHRIEDTNNLNFNEQLHLNSQSQESTKSKTKQMVIPKEIEKSPVPEDTSSDGKPLIDSSKNLFAAIDILEKAHENQNELEGIKKEKTFWEKFGEALNPFKCG